MNHEAIVKIANAQNRMNRLKETHDSFLTNLASHGTSQKLSNNLTATNGVISTVVWGHTLSAVPRIVRDGESDFAVEYTFEHKAGDVVTPIWRFYIMESGYLVSSLSSEGARLCDFNNLYIAEQLLTPINTAVLASKLFAPSQPLSG